MPIQVEVCVQESALEFDESGLDCATDRNHHDSSIQGPISAETWEIWFQNWLEVLQPGLSPIGSYEVSLRLTGDREIQSLNAQYRHQDKPTDVLAFAALEIDYPGSNELQSILPLYLGDIIISIETAQKQANRQSHPLETELAWLASHGLLHLLGWDHPDDESLVQMLNQQQVLLSTVGLCVLDS